MAPHSGKGGLPIAVIDNTLLTRLVLLEIADFLPWLFKQVRIPPEVKREAYKAPHKGKRRLRKLIAEQAGFFIDCHEADEGVKEILKADLGDGEAAALVVKPIRTLAGITIDTRSIISGILLPRRSVGLEVADAFRKYLFGNATLQDLPAGGDDAARRANGASATPQCENIR